MSTLATVQADLPAPPLPLPAAQPTRPAPARSRELAVVAGAGAQLPEATLDEVVAAAGLQTRLDRKYLIGPDTLAQLMARLAGRFSALEIDRRRQFRYESVYFDTADLALYRQHLQGRRRRYKVRTRSYLDSGQCLFEVKLKGRRGQTIKARLPYQMADRTRLTDQARDFLTELLRTEYGIDPPELQPAATITYTRTTLVDFHSGVRPTLDVDLGCTHRGRSISSRGGILIETKSPAHDSPVDRALRQLGARPLKLSKYGLAVAVLYAGVPANPLHRTLRSYFGWQPTPSLTGSSSIHDLPGNPQELCRHVSSGSRWARRPIPTLALEVS
jgi:VTC domain